MKFPVLQSFEKDLNKIVFVINQLSRGLDELIASGGGIPAGLRQPLTADTDFFVAPAASGGSDSNTGLTSGSPWLTLQHAYEAIVGNYDFKGHNAIINLATATGANAYTAGLFVTLPWTGGGQIYILGNTATPSNVLFNLTAAGSTAGHCFYFDCVLPSVFRISGVKLQSSVAGGCGVSHNGRGFVYLTFMDFGTVLADHMACYAAGGFIQVGSAYTISGNARSHVYSSGGMLQIGGVTCTVQNKPTFSTTFAYSAYAPAKVDVFGTFVNQAAKSRRTTTGTTAVGSNIITAIAINTNLLTVGMAVTGINIPSNATITSIDSISQIHISANATGAGAITLKFEIASGQKFLVQFQGGVQTNGAGLDYLPGTTAGASDAGQFALYS